MLRHKRITLEELCSCWLELHPEQLQHAARDAMLLAALEDHASSGLLSLLVNVGRRKEEVHRLPKDINSEC